MRKLVTEIALTAIVFVAIAYVLAKGIDYVTGTETEKRCAVTLCSGNGNEIYEVTVVDTDGNLWSYYDDVPRQRGSVIICEFDGNEIIDAQEEEK